MGQDHERDPLRKDKSQCKVKGARDDDSMAVANGHQLGQQLVPVERYSKEIARANHGLITQDRGSEAFPPQPTQPTHPATLGQPAETPIK